MPSSKVPQARVDAAELSAAVDAIKGRYAILHGLPYNQLRARAWTDRRV